MSAASIPVGERARNMLCTVLQRLQDPGTGTAIATAMGVSEATISRLKSDHLENLCTVLAHCGLRIVPVEAKCFEPEMVEALLTLAKARLSTIESTEQLTWIDGGTRK